jgi:hypothetical protein
MIGASRVAAAPHPRPPTPLSAYLLLREQSQVDELLEKGKTFP